MESENEGSCQKIVCAFTPVKMGQWHKNLAAENIYL